MSELFNNLKQTILEAIRSTQVSYEEDSSIDSGDELEPLECDCITSAPEELSGSVQEESEDNMLLREKGIL